MATKRKTAGKIFVKATATLAGIFFILLMPVAQAADIAGDEIKQLLTDNSVVYEDGARQSFKASGTTFYQSARGRPLERGSWRVSADKYCSRWGGGFSPGSGAEACYTVQYDGESITFDGEYLGVMVPGDVFNSSSD